MARTRELNAPGGSRMIAEPGVPDHNVARYSCPGICDQPACCVELAARIEELTAPGGCRLTTLDAVRVGDHLETMFVLDACRVCLAAEPFERDETNGVLFCRECGSPAA